MNIILYGFLGLIGVIALITLAWAMASRWPFPCPTWLGWIVEMDNPFLKNYRTGEILRHVHLRSGMKVLDFGCGPGRLTIPAARQVGPSGTVTAFDLQPGMLDRARARAAREKVDNILFLQGAAGQGKLGREQYDRALLVTVLGEIPDKARALQEMAEALKPGGLLSITEVIADPHYQTRRNVRALAAASGLKELEFFGSAIAYTINLQKP